MERTELPATLVRIIPNTILTIHEVTCDQFAIRIEYTLDPPFPAIHEWPGTLGWQMMEWEITVEDDRNTEYWPGGGALGTGAGVRSMQPTMPVEAQMLMITIRPFEQATPAYVLQFRAQDIPRQTMDVPQRKLHPWPGMRGSNGGGFINRNLPEKEENDRNSS